MKSTFICAVLFISSFSFAQEKQKFADLVLEPNARVQATGFEVFKDSLNNTYIKGIFRLQPVSLDNASTQLLMADPTSQFANYSFIPFKNLTIKQLNAIVAKINSLEAENNLKE